MQKELMFYLLSAVGYVCIGDGLGKSDISEERPGLYFGV